MQLFTLNFIFLYIQGDDMRQDQLTIQMIRIMDKLWLKEGLWIEFFMQLFDFFYNFLTVFLYFHAGVDLKMVTFSCVPTGDRQGIMEMVTNAKTLREIHVTGNQGFT